MGRELDNYYLILELDFLKPEEDEAVIDKRLREKMRFWNENCERDRKKGFKYKEYKGWALDIGKVMKTPNLRKAEAEDAKTFVNSILKEQLRYLQDKKEIERGTAAAICEKCGIAAPMFEKITGMKIVEGEVYKAEDPNPKVEEHNRYSKNDKALLNLKKANLYEFLAGSNKEDIEAMKSLAGKELIQTYSNPLKEKYRLERTDEATLVKSLCAACEEIFDDKNPKMKANYDAYIIWKKVDDVIKRMVTFAGSQMALNDVQASMFVDDLTQILKNRKAAEKKYRDICAFKGIRSGAPVMAAKTLLCGQCYHVVDIAHGERKCTHCGADLYIKCPSCGKEIPASAESCGFCEFKLQNVREVMTLCKSAKDAVNSMEFIKAKQYIAKAESLWPKYEGISGLRAELQKKENAMGGDMERLNQLASRKEFYKAKEVLEAVQAKYPVARIQNALLIETAYAEAQKIYKEAVSAANEGDLIRLCNQITGICADYPVGALILKYPPKPPSRLQIASDGISGTNTLTWQASTSEGEISYKIIRKENTAAASPEDGRQLGFAGITRFVDTDIKAGVDYYYSVYTVRAGAVSSPVHAHAINYAELTITQKEEGDGYIRINWKQVEGGARVQVVRKENNLPVGPKDGIPVNADASGFVDTGLKNDVKYGYYLNICYYHNGETYETKGISAWAIPTSVPQPVEGISVRNVEDDIFEARWKYVGSENVILYYTEMRNPFSCGDIVDKTTLHKALQPLTLISSNGNLCRFKVPEKKKYIVVPVTLKNNTCVVGEQAVALKKEQIKVKKIHIAGGLLRIEADWPEETSSIILHYSTKEYPVDLEDRKSSVSRTITRKLFDSDGSALCIKNPDRETYYIKMYAVSRVNGEQVYSECGQICFDNSPRTDISYQISIAGLFRSRHVEIRFSSTLPRFTLPAIDIISCLDHVPVYISSGNVVAHLEEQIVEGTYTLTIPCSSLPKKTFLKPFFTDENLYDAIELTPAYGTKFQIS